MSSPDPLLDAAAALLRDDGALSFSALASAAGVSRATVYRRFADKEALRAALVATGRLGPADAAEPDLRAQILDAVGRLLQRQGLAATTIEAVAAEAQVGVATVYRRFTDRKGLLSAFIAERSPRRLGPALDWEGLSAEEGLLVLVTESLRFLRSHRGLVPFLFGLDPEAEALFGELRGQSPSFRALMAQFVDRHFPDPTGRTVAALHGMVSAVALAQDGPIEPDARFLVDAFLRGHAR